MTSDPISLVLVAVMGGEVGITFTSVLETAPHVTSGRLRALGVTALKRSPTLPDVPTISEAALPGYEFEGWHVLVAPKGTPASVVALLSETIRKVLRAPGQPQMYEARGLDVVASSPEECAAYLRNEVAKWGKVIKERGMKAD